MATGTGQRLDDLAHDLFALMTKVSLSVLRGRRRKGELKEVEFLTLTLLQTHGTMIVGDLQRILAVLPAQMSRVIRALENRDRLLITCRINSQDKRKIDVTLTTLGEKALRDYQTARVRRLSEHVRELSEDEHEDLGRTLQKLQTLFGN